MTGLPLPLFIWLSAGFPVGAFAFSHGLEGAVETGTVCDATSLAAWLGDLVAHGAPRCDAVLVSAAWRAASTGDMVAIGAVNELALALAPSRERLLETSAQGNAFLTAVHAAWPAPTIQRFAGAEAETAYPVAVGLAAAAHAVRLHPTLEAFTLAACMNLVSAAVRLGPIGQTEAQAVIAALCPAVRDLAHWAEHAEIADCGTASWGADIASMRHETQYSRLFRS